MSVQTNETRASVIEFPPKKEPAEAIMVADDAGRAIVALLQKAADSAKADYHRAMELAHRLTSELRAAEERAREFEAEAKYFGERAARAEGWLIRIHDEVQRAFFSKDPQQQRPVRMEPARTKLPIDGQ